MSMKCGCDLITVKDLQPGDQIHWYKSEQHDDRVFRTVEHYSPQTKVIHFTDNSTIDTKEMFMGFFCVRKPQ